MLRPTPAPTQDEFDSFFRAYHADILAFARRRAGDEVAHEVTAETFVIAWRRWHRVPREPLPWLYAVARRVLANVLRRERRQMKLASAPADDVVNPPQPDVGDIGSETGSAMRAFRKLRDGDREVLRLIAWEELTPREAAKALGISTTALRVRLHRARQRFIQHQMEDSRPTEASDASIVEANFASRRS